MHKAPHSILLLAATLVVLPSLATCRRSMSERAVAERSTARDQSAAPASVDAGAPASAIRAAMQDAAALDTAAPDAAVPDAAALAPYKASSGDCPVSIDATHVRLAHRAAWSNAWSRAWNKDVQDCGQACIVVQETPPDADGNVYRYHLVVPAQGGGFDVIENVGRSPLPARCGQGLVSTTLIEGEPLHIRTWQLLAAGVAWEYETNDAGETEGTGWHCADEGSVSDYIDFFIDRARHERVLLIKQRINGGDEAEVTVSGGLVRIHGAGCDEQRSMGVRP
jgi:hypothetical protein